MSPEPIMEKNDFKHANSVVPFHVEEDRWLQQIKWQRAGLQVGQGGAGIEDTIPTSAGCGAGIFLQKFSAGQTLPPRRIPRALLVESDALVIVDRIARREFDTSMVYMGIFFLKWIPCGTGYASGEMGISPCGGVWGGVTEILRGAGHGEGDGRAVGILRGGGTGRGRGAVGIPGGAGTGAGCGGGDEDSPRGEKWGGSTGKTAGQSHTPPRPVPLCRANFWPAPCPGGGKNAGNLRPAGVGPRGVRNPRPFATLAERLAFFAIAVNLAPYLILEMHESLPDAATHVTDWIGTAYVLTLMGVFFADAYLGRFKTMIIFSCIYATSRLPKIVYAHLPALAKYVNQPRKVKTSYFWCTGLDSTRNRRDQALWVFFRSRSI
ncbi:hypothetical protein Sjap_010241 [Stephania japonica]|uniref:Uncharacterized protein n=1 Tax=Stephania japonica TaxID=461633 RepID=A0AAP0J983_9MAGN